jgi:hypothetical protein
MPLRDDWVPREDWPQLDVKCLTYGGDTGWIISSLGRGEDC